MQPFEPNRFPSRVIELREPRPPPSHGNAPTIFYAAPLGAHPNLFHYRFLANYAEIRALVTEHTKPGVAVVALDERGVAARAWIAAKIGELNTAIIGRHRAADVLLEADETLSLRHLALLVYPQRAGLDVRFRLVDLRTATAFADEHGRRLGALEAEGPAFVTCGRHCIFLLSTGDELGWPDDPESGWQCIPERIYFDEHAAEPDRWRRKAPAPPPPPAGKVPAKRVTTVRVMAMPAAAERALLGADEQPLGTLEIASPLGRDAVLLGPAAARDGVLLGRYERCDTHGLPALADWRVSRVHCLVVLVDGCLYAVDAASQNGMFARVACVPGFPPLEHRMRCMALGPGSELSLGPGLNILRWRAAGADPHRDQQSPPVVLSPLVH